MFPVIASLSVRSYFESMRSKRGTESPGPSAIGINLARYAALSAASFARCAYASCFVLNPRGL